MKETEGFVVNLCKQPGSKDDMSIRKNIQRKLAARLKQVTQKHRLMQKTHMENVQNKPGEEVANEGGLFDEKFEDFSQIAKVRDEGINVLVSNINELAIIFKELNMLVVDQGTILDRIDYNLTLARENTSKAVVFLGKAEKHQNCTRATSCLLFLIILIVVLLLLLIYKNF